MTENHPRHMTYAEAAKYLNIKLATLQSLVNQQRVPHLRLGKRFVRFDVEALRRWLDEKTIAASK